MAHILTSRNRYYNFYTCAQDNINKPIGYWVYDYILWREHISKHKIYIPNFIYSLYFDFTNINIPNRDKVLKIETLHDFDKFTILFGIKNETCSCSNCIIHIDWKKVAEYFGGIVVSFDHKYRLAITDSDKYTVNLYRANGFKIGKRCYTWLEKFCLYSGCVWEKSAIKSFYLKTII